MQLSPVSFNGTNINDGTNYEAIIERGNAQGQPGAEAQYIKRPGAWPVYTGKNFQPTSYTMKILCKGDFAEQFETLNRLFYTGDEETHLFVVKDEDDSDRQYQVYATPTGQPLFGNDGNAYTVKLAFDDPIWQGVTLQESTWSITGTTDSTTVTPAGNMDTYPVFEITPTSAPSTDYRYMTFVRVLPQSSNPWLHRPLDIVGSTWNFDSTNPGFDPFDTSNLVSTGQMRSDGNDLRVFVNGNEVDRWLAFNGSDTDTVATSTNTHVWIVADLPPAREMILRTSISAASTTLEVQNTTANRKLLNDCPDKGWLVLDTSLGSTDSEDIYYEAKTITDTRLGFELAARGARGTTALTHAALTTNVRFMPLDIRMVWGDPDATAPDVDDRNKPLVASYYASKNNYFYYNEATGGNFVDADQMAPDLWSYQMQRHSNQLGRSNIFTTTDTQATTDLSLTFAPLWPAHVMGSKIGSYNQAGVWRYDYASITWSNHFPDEIYSIGFGNDVYRSSTTLENSAFRLWLGSENQPDSKKLFSEQALTTAAAGTWESTSISIPSSDIGSDAFTYVYFTHEGVSGSGQLDWIASQTTSADVILKNPPHIKYWNAAAGTHVQMHALLENITTGEGIHIDVPMLENDALVIDCNPSAPTVKLNGSVITGAVELDSLRDHWMTLLGAANVLGYTCHLSEAITVTIKVRWYNRMSYL